MESRKPTTEKEDIYTRTISIEGEDGKEPALVITFNDTKHFVDVKVNITESSKYDAASALLTISNIIMTDRYWQDESPLVIEPSDNDPKCDGWSN